MNGNTPPQGPTPMPQEPPRPYSPPTPPSPPPPPPRMTPPPPPSYNPPSPQPQSVPPPPPPEVGVRTMASDVSGMRSSGGMEPQPKTFRPEDLGRTPVFEPQSPGAPGTETKKPAPTRMIIIIGGFVAFIVIAGAVFYLFIRPILSPAQEVLPTETTPPITETQPPIGTTPPAPPAETFTHKSFFNPAPKLSETVVPENLGLADLTSAIQKATGDTQTPGSVKELTLASTKLGASDILGVLLPDLDKKFTLSAMAKDFSALAYYDKDGVWPAYVFQFNSGTDLASAKTTVGGIESSKNLINFYLTSPGESKATAFKDGAEVSGNTVRYLSYAKPGSSFNYAILNNYFVISTSHSGFKEATKLLGF